MHDTARVKGSKERPSSQAAVLGNGLGGNVTWRPEDGSERWWLATRLHREMAYTGGALYASGGLLVLATVLLPSWNLHAPNWVAGVGVVAVLVGVFYLWSAEHLPMPLWQYSLATSLGGVLVTVAVFGGGPETTATYGMLYVFVTGYGFFFYPWPLAAWFVVLSGVGFAAALAWHDVRAALVQWIVVVGGAVIAGGLIGTLGRRVRRLLVVEQARLEDMSRWTSGRPPSCVLSRTTCARPWRRCSGSSRWCATDQSCRTGNVMSSWHGRWALASGCNG